MTGANFRGAAGDFEVRRNPFEIGINEEESAELVDEILIVIAIRLDQNFGHSELRRDRPRAGLFQPLKDWGGQIYIARIGLKLVDEDVCIQSDTAMVSQKSADGGSSQLRRSFFR